jgi:hypothetical protein
MAFAPSAFVCGAAWARAMWFFTVFVLVSVIRKLLGFEPAVRRRAELACVEAARFRPAFVAPDPRPPPGSFPSAIRLSYEAALGLLVRRNIHDAPRARKIRVGGRVRVRRRRRARQSIFEAMWWSVSTMRTAMGG